IKNSESITGIKRILSHLGPAVTVEFNGETMTEDNVEIARAEYKWKGDSEIIPGTYTTDVTLTIIARN
ncbi:MAG: hypothetical protein ACFN3H_03055, partial [Spirochaetales bacterium]